MIKFSTSSYMTMTITLRRFWVVKFTKAIVAVDYPPQFYFCIFLVWFWSTKPFACHFGSPRITSSIFAGPTSFPTSCCTEGTTGTLGTERVFLLGIVVLLRLFFAGLVFA